MFLQLSHKNLEVYKVSRELMKECYKMILKLPDDEKYNLVRQIRKASLSVKLNLAEGSSRKSGVERKRFYEISRGSVIEINAAVEAAIDLDYLDKSQLEEFGKLLNSSFALLSKLISAS